MRSRVIPLYKSDHPCPEAVSGLCRYHYRSHSMDRIFYKERAEVDVPLRHFRRQYEELSQFERGRIIGMMEAGWSARRVARQLGHSDCVPTASSAAIQAYVVPSLGAPVSSRTIRRHLAGGNLGSRNPLHVLLLPPTPRRPPFGVVRNWTAAEWNQVVFSDESRFNLSSDDNRVRVWRPRGERFNPAFALQRHTALTASVLPFRTIHGHP
ncbi:transposable element Tcb2 transposase [Trichonephila clavipes]|nr:transposable element Tcb2 transposase [Trichonephila clavipes]